MSTSTLNVIAPILERTYGATDWTQSLAVHLAQKIDAYEGEDRERAVMLTCWDWMTGGTTAASVARKIEDALPDA